MADVIGILNQGERILIDGFQVKQALATANAGVSETSAALDLATSAKAQVDADLASLIEQTTAAQLALTNLMNQRDKRHEQSLLAKDDIAERGDTLRGYQTQVSAAEASLTANEVALTDFLKDAENQTGQTGEKILAILKTRVEQVSALFSIDTAAPVAVDQVADVTPATPTESETIEADAVNTTSSAVEAAEADTDKLAADAAASADVEAAEQEALEAEQTQAAKDASEAAELAEAEAAAQLEADEAAAALAADAEAEAAQIEADEAAAALAADAEAEVDFLEDANEAADQDYGNIDLESMVADIASKEASVSSDADAEAADNSVNGANDEVDMAVAELSTSSEGEQKTVDLEIPDFMRG